MSRLGESNHQPPTTNHQPSFYQTGRRLPVSTVIISANPMNPGVFRWCRPCTPSVQHLQGGCLMRHTRSALALALVWLAVSPARASAQPSPDFLFGSPKGMVGFRSGWMFASAKSDLFTFVQRHLTVDRKDFNAPAIGVDVEVAMAPRVSAIVGFDFARTSKDSS